MPEYIARISYGKDSLKMLDEPPKFVPYVGDQISFL